MNCQISAHRIRSSVLLPLAVLLLFLAPPRRALAFASPEDLAISYLQAIEAGNWTAAEEHWASADRSDARRLDIVYENVPLKIDCASWFVLERGRWSADRVQVRVVPDPAESSLVRLRCQLGLEHGGRVVNYHAARIDGDWRLALATTALAEGWERTETGFLDLRIGLPGRMTDHAAGVLDDFVRETCRRLGVPPERIEHLRRHKLQYFLADEATVERIAGAPTRGVALLPNDAVVTSEPCHLHELAHLLVNYALQEVPLYTLPFLQEGTAVALGGRWGRSPQAMAGLGKFSLQSGMITVEDLLPLNRFREQGADWTYAPSGVLTAYLLRSLGSEPFLDLYRLLSGDYAEISRWTEEMIRKRICVAAGRDWPALEGGLEEYVEALPCGGIGPATALGGEVRARARCGEGEVVVSRDGRNWYWSVPGAGSPGRCVILLRSPGVPAVNSRLFAEQLPDRDYAGESHALILTPGEVGLYDFRSDLLQVKYVEGFCQDYELVDEATGNAVFRMDARQLPDTSWRIESVIVEP